MMKRTLLAATLLFAAAATAQAQTTTTPGGAPTVDWLLNGADVIRDADDQHLHTLTGLNTLLAVDGDVERAALRAWSALADRFGAAMTEASLARGVEGVHRVAVHLQLQHDGIDLVGGRAVLGFDRDGALRTVTATGIDATDAPSSTPSIDAEAAYAELFANARADAPLGHTIGDARLVYYARHTNLRLAWELRPQVAMPTQSHVAWVDAHTGEYIAHENVARFEGMANVYESNPGADGALPTIEVELPPYDVDNGILVNERIEAFNCVDRGEFTTYGDYEIPHCTPEHLAEPDSAGDFLYSPAPYDPQDEFAEVHMFHHANRAFTFLAGLGLEGVEHMPLASVTNFHVAGLLQSGNDGLEAYDNAAFIPPGSGGFYTGSSQAALIFGQGTSVDFSYDGDVIYHEFGHAAVSATSNLEFLVLDRQGVSVAPGAMNEGYADYFSCAITNDPSVGDYVGPTFESSGMSDRDSIRNLDNDLVCPSVLWGEVHQDSKHFSGALWDGRELWIEGGGDRELYDAAVFDAMISLDGEATFDDAAAMTVDTVSDLDADLGAQLEEIFEARAVTDCDRFIPLGDGDLHGLHIIYGGEALGLEPFAPGTLSFMVSVPEGTGAIELHYNFWDAGSYYGEEMQHRWIVGDSPHVFSTSRGRVDGNWDDILTPGGRAINTVRYEGDLAGDYYFMAVGVNGQQGYIVDVSAEVFAAEIEEDTGVADTGVIEEDTGVVEEDTGIVEEDTGVIEEDSGSADTGTSADAESDAGLPDIGTTNLRPEAPEGCECSSTSAPTAGAWALMAMVLGLVRRRRR